ncbi:MAG TPA: hypothetical protein VJ646_19265, partial [Candidatus Binatia bacterium]|nr:hypothetical protein [Candidatus Binatia bacterium]
MNIKKIVLLLVYFFVVRAEAQVIDTITKPGGQKFPIAVSPLKNLGTAGDAAKLSEGLADTMAYDLDLSGWFKVLDRSAYIERPQNTGITLGTFDFKNWSTLGAEGLVKGGFS